MTTTIIATSLSAVLLFAAGVLAGWRMGRMSSIPEPVPTPKPAIQRKLSTHDTGDDPFSRARGKRRQECKETIRG